jgi:hypothetical protein
VISFVREALLYLTLGCFFLGGVLRLAEELLGAWVRREVSDVRFYET